MKLHVYVQGNHTASPAGAPALAPGSLPTPSSKKNHPSSDIPNSSELIGGGRVSQISAFLVSMATLLWML